MDYKVMGHTGSWHDHFADIGFQPCGVYKYIAVYVDDLAIAAKYPEKIIEDIKVKPKLTLKCTGPLKVHLDYDFKRDSDFFSFGPKTFI
jgi:hypothetical protein